VAYVTVINKHQHVQQIVAGRHYVTADATASTGGSDAGMAPRELLLASLGACTAIALRRHALRKDWVLGTITIGLRWSRTDAKKDRIDRRLTFSEPLTKDQKKYLLDVVTQTLITNLLLSGTAIQSSVVDAASSPINPEMTVATF
jgi:putative redox protein